MYMYRYLNVVLETSRDHLLSQDSPSSSLSSSLLVLLSLSLLSLLLLLVVVVVVVKIRPGSRLKSPESL